MDALGEGDHDMIDKRYGSKGYQKRLGRESRE
jgi:hypothetical protein